MNDIPTLKRAIAAMHGCDCSHVETSKVHEMMDGATVWRGEVETFSLSGHPKAVVAYAWTYMDDSNEKQHVAILKLPPVVGPREAVQVTIASRLLK